MTKVIDLKKSVYELVSEHPEAAGIMAAQGFSEIRKKGVLGSVGKLMTIPKGARLRKIPLDGIIRAFRAAGFEVANIPADITGGEESAPAPKTAEAGTERTELLKGYLRRLNAGEPLEQVRHDFAIAFSSVSSSEIMQAEQELLREGEPLREVQKLCDVHSALFRDKIREAKKQEPASIAMAKENAGRSRELTAIDGHPLQTLTRENENLKELIDTVRRQIKDGEDCLDTLRRIREVGVHYAKKGDLLYPQLNVKYGIIGPSQVMWTLDDEIRAELSSLTDAAGQTPLWKSRVRAVVQRADDMIYKEENILFPVCAANFTGDEWKQIYLDSKDYAPCLGVEPRVWGDAEQQAGAGAGKDTAQDGIISLPTGSLTIAQLRAMLNTLPFEITFVDDKDINRYFNEGAKAFKRPLSALGRKVFTCHPPKIEPMVRAIIDDFRNGRKDCVPIWMTKNGRATLVEYMAVRDAAGHYLGTMEIVQDMEDARKHLQ